MNRKLFLKSPIFVPFGANLAQLETKSDTPDMEPNCDNLDKNFWETVTLDRLDIQKIKYIGRLCLKTQQLVKFENVYADVFAIYGYKYV